MKNIKLNNINWFLEDNELIGTLETFDSKQNEKRGYFILDYDDRKIFVKFFREKGAVGFLRNRISPRGKKEYWSGKRLLELSILTPKPIGYGISDRGSYSIQEWIEGNTFLDVFINGRKQMELLCKLADILRILKTHSVRHNDLHLNNIIINKDDLYLIDLHKMSIKKQFGLRDEVSNLSHAITMLYDGMSDIEKEFFFVRYGARDIKALVESEIKRLWERWVRKKQKRAFRNTSKIILKENSIYIAGREMFTDAGLLQLIKKDKKTTVERHGNHIRKIYRDKRRLKKAWKNHVALKYLDLAITPEPYYLKLPSIFTAGYIAMEDLGTSGEELDIYLDRVYDNMSRKERRAFIERFSRFFSVLFKKKIAHKDLKGCNLFVLKDGSFRILDVEDIIFIYMDEERLKRMLIQLNTTIPEQIGAKDRIRFYLNIVKNIKVDKKQLLIAVEQGSLRR